MAYMTVQVVTPDGIKMITMQPLFWLKPKRENWGVISLRIDCI
jgi:hypothetical protein